MSAQEDAHAAQQAQIRRDAETSAAAQREHARVSAEIERQAEAARRAAEGK
jgi:hypothetical protein